MKPLRFTLLQTLCGAVAGWVLVAVFLALHWPRQMIFMPVNMWEDWLRVEILTGYLEHYSRAGLLLAALAACVSWYAVARRLNPAMPAFPFVKAPAPGLVWASFLLGGFIFYAGMLEAAAVNGPFYGDFTGCVFNFGASWLNHVQVGLITIRVD